MVITGITVCVDYADYFSRSIKLWEDGLNDMIVVTAPSDLDTTLLCKDWHVPCIATEVFYENGAKFNKGAAISEAFEFMDKFSPFDYRNAGNEWLLFFDSDIIPPDNWRDVIEKANPQVGNLYGAWRYGENGKRIPDPDICGWFYLANTDDPNMQKRPIVETHWAHAGNYDSEFQQRWPKEKRIVLPLHLTHLGETWRNWCGRGNDKEMKELLAERSKKRGWKHEAIGGQ